jgi:hypothetical protein
MCNIYVFSVSVTTLQKIKYYGGKVKNSDALLKSLTRQSAQNTCTFFLTLLWSSEQAVIITSNKHRYYITPLPIAHFWKVKLQWSASDASERRNLPFKSESGLPNPWCRVSTKAVRVMCRKRKRPFTHWIKGKFLYLTGSSQVILYSQQQQQKSKAIPVTGLGGL